MPRGISLSLLRDEHRRPSGVVLTAEAPDESTVVEVDLGADPAELARLATDLAEIARTLRADRVRRIREGL